ncbi:hypothetical protein K449DRAFT_110315 [Hypoxylon sp. EC38]|nr:hypothetical protein K449DRAFT_110315 [Hypoxylon sp. EC38]
MRCSWLIMLRHFLPLDRPREVRYYYSQTRNTVIFLGRPVEVNLGSTHDSKTLGYKVNCRWVAVSHGVVLSIPQAFPGLRTCRRSLLALRQISRSALFQLMPFFFFSVYVNGTLFPAFSTLLTFTHNSSIVHQCIRGK